MLAMAQERIRSGASVLLDATFSLRKWRQAAWLLARDLNANLVCVECRCRARTLRRRLGARRDETGLSDARPEHLDEMTAEFEPLDDLPRNTHLRVDTEKDFHESLDVVLGRAHVLCHAQVNARI